MFLSFAQLLNHVLLYVFQLADFILYVLQGLPPGLFLLLVLNLQLLLVVLPVLTFEVDKLPLLVLNHLGMLSLLNNFKVFLIYSSLITVAFLHLNLFAITLGALKKLLLMSVSPVETLLSYLQILNSFCFFFLFSFITLSHFVFNFLLVTFAGF